MSGMALLLSFGLTVFGTPAMAAPPAAQELKSPALAAELQTVMSEKKLDAIALPDPERPGAYIAVLVFPKVQLLVVAARHDSGDYLKYQIEQKKYREVYSQLQQSSVTPDRVFFQDMGADGLQARGAVDVMYVQGKQTIVGGGKTNAKQMREADERYSRMLRFAIDAARAHQDSSNQS